MYRMYKRLSLLCILLLISTSCAQIDKRIGVLPKDEIGNIPEELEKLMTQNESRESIDILDIDKINEEKEYESVDIEQEKDSDDTSFYGLGRGVIVDSNLEAVYLMTPDSQIEKVSVDSGAVLWKSSEAAKPLAIFGSNLIAQVENNQDLEIAILDTRNGKYLYTFDFTLPKEVGSTGINGSPFNVNVNNSDESPLLNWKYNHRTVYGFGSGPITSLSGSFLLNLKSGRATKLVLPEPTKPTPGPAPYKPFTNTYYSVDNKHSSTWSKLLSDDRQDYQWSVKEIESGEEIGRIKQRTSTSPFFIQDNMLVRATLPYSIRIDDEMVDVKKMVKAVHLVDGSEKWSRLVRDTNYTGPYPP